MELNILNIATLFYISASSILIVFLLSSKTISKLSNIMLSAYLMLTVQDVGSHFTSMFIYKEWPIIGMLISLTTFLIIPSLYLFVKSSVYRDFRLKYISLLHAAPMAIVNLLIIPIYYKPLIEDPALDWISLVSKGSFINLVYISLHIQIFVYYFFIFRLLLRYRGILLENYTGPKLDNYKWLMQFISILFFQELISTAKNIFRFGDIEPLYSIFVLLTQISVVIIIFWLVIKALKRPELFSGINASAVPVNQMIDEETENLRLGNVDESSPYPEILTKLENHMKVNEPFMDSSLNLYDLAKQINVPSRELSIAINYVQNKHFFDYVNEYRIKKAMEIFNNTNDDKLTVLEVLYEVGFNSKSSFYTAFKKFTGITPSEFKRKASNSAA